MSDAATAGAAGVDGATVSGDATTLSSVPNPERFGGVKVSTASIEIW